MQFYFIIALVFAVLVATFALQNSQPVDIKFMTWKIEQVSQVLVIFIAACTGAIAAIFISIGKQIRLRLQVRHLQNENKQLKETCETLKQQVPERPAAETQPSVDESNTNTQNNENNIQKS